MRSAALFLLLLFAVTSCTTEKISLPTENEQESGSVTTTIAGLVFNETGAPVAGATVTAHGHTILTNKYGLFVIKGISVPKSNCVVSVAKEGFHTGYRAEVPAEDITNVRIEMTAMRHDNTISGALGGTVNMENGASIEIPENGVVTEAGQAYNGTVVVSARWLDPTLTSFYRGMPGSLIAKRSNGKKTLLYFHSTVLMDVRTSTGEPLRLASGKKATVRYPIPSVEGEYASTVPMWSFDEVDGLWHENGKASRNGNIYTGQIASFDAWSCAVAFDKPGTVNGEVRSAAGTRGWVVLTIGQKEIVADRYGNYSEKVPTGMRLDIIADAEFNMGSSDDDYVMPLWEDQSVRQDLNMYPLSTVYGTLATCKGDTTEGYVQIIARNKTGYAVNYVVSDKKGGFNTSIPSDILVDLTAFGYEDNRYETTIFPAWGSLHNTSLGTLKMCD